MNTGLMAAVRSGGDVRGRDRAAARERRPTPSTMPDATSNAGPPTNRDSNAPTMVAGMPPTSDQRTTSRSIAPARPYWRAPASAAGMVAGSGDAMAAKPESPASDSNGVANDEPPTPNRPSSPPTITPTIAIASRCMVVLSRRAQPRSTTAAWSRFVASSARAAKRGSSMSASGSTTRTRVPPSGLVEHDVARQATARPTDRCRALGWRASGCTRRGSSAAARSMPSFALSVAADVDLGEDAETLRRERFTDRMLGVGDASSRRWSPGRASSGQIQEHALDVLERVAVGLRLRRVVRRNRSVRPRPV